MFNLPIEPYVSNDYFIVSTHYSLENMAVIFKMLSMNMYFGIKFMGTFDDKSTLVQVIACWLRFISWHGFSRAKRVNLYVRILERNSVREYRSW